MSKTRALSSINQFSPEHLQLIFSQLSFNDLKLARQVCELWKEVIDKSVLLTDKGVYCKLVRDYLNPLEFPKLDSFLSAVAEAPASAKEDIILDYREHHKTETLKRNTKLIRQICSADKYLCCPQCIVGEPPMGPENNIEELGCCEMTGWSAISALIGMLLALFLLSAGLITLKHGNLGALGVVGLVFGGMLGGAGLGIGCALAFACIPTKGFSNVVAKRSEKEAREFFGLFGKKNTTDQVIYMEEGIGMKLEQ